MLLYAPSERQAAVEEALCGFTRMDLGFCPDGSRIVFAD
jgi:hypothetical protein